VPGAAALVHTSPDGLLHIHACREVPDPYYGGDAGFERVLDLAEDASRSVLSRLRLT